MAWEDWVNYESFIREIRPRFEPDSSQKLSATSQKQLLEETWGNCIAKQRTHATMNRWKLCFLRCPCQGYIQRRPICQSVERERVRRHSFRWEMQKLVTGAGDSLGTQPAVGSRYQAAQWWPWLRTLVSVWFVKCSHELFKSSINPITNPDPVYQFITRQYA
jgi:hypothetical protein